MPIDYARYFDQLDKTIQLVSMSLEEIKPYLLEHGFLYPGFIDLSPFLQTVN